MTFDMGEIGSVMRRWYVVIAIVILVTAVVIRVRAGELPALSSIPTPSLPNPNARGTFSQAESIETRTGQIDRAMYNPDYSDLGKPPLHENPNDPNSDWHRFSNAEKAKLVADNKPALAVFRKGLSEQYFNPQPRSVLPMYPYYGHDRDFSYLVCLDAEARAQRGDWNNALNDCLDCVAFGNRIQRGSPIVGLEEGAQIEERGMYAMRVLGIVDHLTSSQALSGAVRLAQIDRDDVPFSSILQEEAWAQKATLIDTLNRPGWRSEFFNPPSNVSYSDAMRIQSRGLLATKTGSFEKYAGYLDRVVSYSRLPLPVQEKTPAPAPDSNDPVSSRMHDMSQMYDLKDIHTFKAESLATTRLGELELALRAYDLQHHEYPAGLDQLAPSYIQSVPVDPNTEHEPEYMRTMNGYTLYEGKIRDFFKESRSSNLFDREAGYLSVKPAQTFPFQRGFW